MRRRWDNVVAGFVALAGVSAAQQARAACPVDVVPADAVPAWQAAVEDAGRFLSRTRTDDCASVEVAVRPSGGALLTFTTTDGRRAVRGLLGPDELVPALEALVVLPAAPPSQGARPVAPRQEPAASVARPAAPSPSPPPPPPAREVHFQVAAAGGARLGFAGPYASPALSLRPSGTFGGWELAGTVEYDPSFAYAPGAPVKIWSFAATLYAGRRERLGPVALGYGLGLGMAALRADELASADGATKVTDFVQPRLATFVRLVTPPGGRVRGTVDLGLDVGLGSVKRRATLQADLPDLPRWGAVLAAGVEASFL